MENNIIQKSNRGKTILLDSDYRGGAILYCFVTSLLLAYAIINSILWQEVRLKPSQSVTYSGATALFIISIIIAIFGAGAFIYSIYKLITTQEQRERISKNFVAWASQPSGVTKKSELYEPQDLKNIAIQQPDEPRNRDIIATGGFGESKFPASGQGVARQLDFSGF
jgi:hypothetical protein